MNFRPYPGKLSLVSLAVSACIASGVAQGAGFALNELSASAAGSANAGRAANPEDASIMSSNPAGIAFLDKAQWTFGGAVVAPTGEVENASGCKGGVPAIGGGCRDANKTTGDSDDFLSPAFVPSAYFSAPINEKWSAGFGMYVPFASKTEYDDDFAGAYLATKTELTNINLQSTLSYKFNDNLSVGLGLFASHMEGTLSNRQFLLGMEMDSVMEGDDWGYGWNIGMLWYPTERTSVGMSYTSKVDFTVEGDLEVSGGATGKAPGSLDVTLPDKFEIGITHQLDDRWTLLAGALWTGWSSFDEINAIAGEGLTVNVPGLGDVPVYGPGDVATHVPENWKDSWAWSVGAEYKYNSQWTLKGGYAYDNSPVRNEYRTARIPDVDREWLTIGAKYQPNQDYTIDMAYGYMLKKDTSVNETDHEADGTPGDVSFQGEYKDMGAHVLMVSLTRRF